MGDDGSENGSNDGSCSARRRKTDHALPRVDEATGVPECEHSRSKTRGGMLRSVGTTREDGVLDIEGRLRGDTENGEEEGRETG